MSEDFQTNYMESVKICDLKKKKKDWELSKFSRKSDVIFPL